MLHSVLHISDPTYLDSSINLAHYKISSSRTVYSALCNNTIVLMFVSQVLNEFE